MEVVVGRRRGKSGTGMEVVVGRSGGLLRRSGT